MKVFFKNVDLYNEFLTLYDEAVKEQSTMPEETAWIRLREKYIEGDEEWVLK